jgi:uncharacterized protein YndB with AHSA1/START domain
LLVTRQFEAPLEWVWRAWTESDLLDLWWAPKPWKTKTKAFDFREGGSWWYQIVNPPEPGIWAVVDFTAIDKYKSFKTIHFFSDESGKKNPELPVMYSEYHFIGEGLLTRVEVEIHFDHESELEKIIQMGFESGFSSALKNLDGVLKNISTTKIKNQG